MITTRESSAYMRRYPARYGFAYAFSFPAPASALLYLACRTGELFLRRAGGRPRYVRAESQ